MELIVPGGLKWRLKQTFTPQRPVSSGVLGDSSKGIVETTKNWVANVALHKPVMYLGQYIFLLMKKTQK